MTMLFVCLFFPCLIIFLKRSTAISTGVPRSADLSILFGKPLIIAMEIIAFLTMCVLAIKHALVWRVRERRIKHVKSGHRLQHLIPYGCDPSVFEPKHRTKMPKVGLVLPVKFVGVKSASPKDNWKTQLTSLYAGEMEAVFSVESEDDGAVPLIREIQEELKDRLTVKLVVAGLTGTGPDNMHSQKIHNMLAGLKSCSEDCKYVLFMDVGCRLHPGSVHALVHELEKDRDCFVATGYPLDIPAPQATFWAWCQSGFRYTCNSDLLSDRSMFVWGGAMLLRKSDLDSNRHHVLDRWRKGGYADDMVVLACALDNQRAIATPIEALFANPIKADVSLEDFWNFLCRQIFVMTTYQSFPNRVRHLSLFFVFGMAGLCMSGALLCLGAKIVICLLYGPSLLFPVSAACSGAIAIAFAALIKTWHENLQAGTRLISALSPDAAAVDLNHQTHCIHALSAWAFFLAAWLCCLRTLCMSSVTWRGIHYRFKNGRLVEVKHPK